MNNVLTFDAVRNKVVGPGVVFVQGTPADTTILADAIGLPSATVLFSGHLYVLVPLIRSMRWGLTCSQLLATHDGHEDCQNGADEGGDTPYLG